MEAFVLVKSFQLSVISVRKAGNTHSGTPLFGRLPYLTKLESLASGKQSSLFRKKKVYKIDSHGQCLKLFLFVNNEEAK